MGSAPARSIAVAGSDILLADRRTAHWPYRLLGRCRSRVGAKLEEVSVRKPGQRGGVEWGVTTLTDSRLDLEPRFD